MKPDVESALGWLDDFVARCNGDDRGSCEQVNLIRKALEESSGQHTHIATVLMPDPLDERPGVSLSHADLKRLNALRAGTRIYVDTTSEIKPA